MLKKLRILKNTEKKKIQVSLVRRGWKDLKEKIKEMGGRWKEIEKPNEVVNIVEKVLKFNRQN